MQNKPSYFINADQAYEIASVYEKQLKEIFVNIRTLSDSGKFELPYYQEITGKNKEIIISYGYDIFCVDSTNPAFSNGIKYVIKWNKE